MRKHEEESERIKNTERRSSFSISSSRVSESRNASTVSGAKALDSFKEKELTHTIEQLRSILRDNQTELGLYVEQIGLLKEQCKKMDRSDTRMYVNSEYVKNVVVSFMESKTPLVNS